MYAVFRIGFVFTVAITEEKKTAHLEEKEKKEKEKMHKTAKFGGMCGAKPLWRAYVFKIK